MLRVENLPANRAGNAGVKRETLADHVRVVYDPYPRSGIRPVL